LKTEKVAEKRTGLKALYRVLSIYREKNINEIKKDKKHCIQNFTGFTIPPLLV
jgi:hypothetical protein